MALRNILTNGDNTLRKHSRKVEKFDQRLSDLIDDMFETMYKNNGCGLAAVQVGVLKRVFVCDTGEGPMEFVNPEIIESEGEQIGPEGCLSVPGYSGVTKRPMSVKIKAQDRTGKWYIRKGTELAARCFCHENDHLDGILFTDNAESLERVSVD